LAMNCPGGRPRVFPCFALNFLGTLKGEMYAGGAMWTDTVEHEEGDPKAGRGFKGAHTSNTNHKECSYFYN